MRHLGRRGATATLALTIAGTTLACGDKVDGQGVGIGLPDALGAAIDGNAVVSGSDGPAARALPAGAIKIMAAGLPATPPIGQLASSDGLSVRLGLAATLPADWPNIGLALCHGGGCLTLDATLPELATAPAAGGDLILSSDRLRAWALRLTNPGTLAVLTPGRRVIDALSWGPDAKQVLGDPLQTFVSQAASPGAWATTTAAAGATEVQRPPAQP